MSSKKRIIGYARESTREQAKYGFNLDDQEKKIKKYAELYFDDGTYTLEVVREEGASAKSLDRPRMKELITAVKQRRVDVIIIHNLDRLTRQVKDLATLLELFQQYDVSLISITEKIDTKSAMGRFFIYLIVLIAQWEWETISSRSIRGIEESARQGNYALPGAPFGYKRNPDDNHKLIIEDSESIVVKRIFDSIAHKDYSVIELAHELNKEKAGSRSWSEEGVKKILANKIYFGTFSRFGVEYPNHTIPIISEELYELTQERLKSSNKRQLRSYLYKGLIVCSSCGNVMKNKCGGRKGGMHQYYQCKHCGVQIAETTITTQFMDRFNELLRHESYLTDIEMLQSRYKEVANLLIEIPESMFTYGLSAKQMSKMYGETKEEQEKLEKCLKEVLAGYQKADFELLSFIKKREFLATNIESMTFDKKTMQVEISFRSVENSVKEKVKRTE